MDKSEVKNTVVKSQKKICMISLMLVFYDMFAVTAAYFLALWVRFDADFDMIPREYLEPYVRFIPFYVIGCVFLFTALKLYDSIWKYASFVELFRVMVATMISGMAHTVLITALIRRMPISYYLFGMIFQFFLVLGIRFAYRFYLIMRNRYTRGTTIYKRVMIIGAGEAGKNVIKELHRSEEINETPVCIIDKDQSKWNRTVEGVPVVGGKESILLNVEKYKVEKIYFAIPTASKQQQRDILSICNVQISL